MDEYQPEVVLSIGQAGNRPEICFTDHVDYPKFIPEIDYPPQDVTAGDNRLSKKLIQHFFQFFNNNLQSFNSGIFLIYRFQDMPWSISGTGLLKHFVNGFFI